MPCSARPGRREDAADRAHADRRRGRSRGAAPGRRWSHGGDAAPGVEPGDGSAHDLRVREGLPQVDGHVARVHVAAGDLGQQRLVRHVGAGFDDGDVEVHLGVLLERPRDVEADVAAAEDQDLGSRTWHACTVPPPTWTVRWRSAGCGDERADAGRAPGRGRCRRGARSRRAAARRQEQPGLHRAERDGHVGAAAPGPATAPSSAPTPLGRSTATTAGPRLGRPGGARRRPPSPGDRSAGLAPHRCRARRRARRRPRPRSRGDRRRSARPAGARVAPASHRRREARPHGSGDPSRTTTAVHPSASELGARRAGRRRRCSRCRRARAGGPRASGRCGEHLAHDRPRAPRPRGPSAARRPRAAAARPRGSARRSTRRRGDVASCDHRLDAAFARRATEEESRCASSSPEATGSSAARSSPT